MLTSIVLGCIWSHSLNVKDYDEPSICFLENMYMNKFPTCCIGLNSRKDLSGSSILHACYACMVQTELQSQIELYKV